MRCALGILLLLASGLAVGQVNSPSASPAKVDAPGELDKLKNTCGQFTFKSVPDCVDELFTGQPVHIAVGSIAPQDGFGAGLAYVGHKNTDNWRMSWDADAVGSVNASWRAGAYANFVHAGIKPIGVQLGSKHVKPNLTGLPEHAVISLYAQVISLNKLTYFGLGPDTVETGRSFYGMTETIAGGSGVKPLSARLHLTLYGEVNGRFVDLRPSPNQPSPSIGQLYTEATAPGLTTQPSTIQFGEGLRLAPVVADDRLRLNYRATYQQYVAPGSILSFQRVTTDLGHQFALYRDTTRFLGARPGNGPDDCSLDPAAEHSECPKLITRNLEGSIGFRVYSALSMTQGDNIVPFYYQPTLGGTDINGNPWLSSYQDYRFRAPNLLLLRENVEHSIGKWPLGATFIADQALVALTPTDLGSAPWLHSFSAGLTLRAGGLPEVYLLFAWGGNEGTHTIANVNTSLLGGAARPSLY